MVFEAPTSLRPVLERMDQFVRDELIPLESEFLEGPAPGILPALDEKREKVRALGLWAPHMPREYGGAGLSMLEYAHASEVLGRCPLGHYTFGCQAPDAGNMELLLAFGNEAQKEEYLRPLVSGEFRSCFAMTEPDRAGSNPVWMDTTAVRDGDSYVIDGRKWFTSAADGARFAIVMAVTDPNATRHQRASMIIVPCDTPGFRVDRNTSVMGAPGAGYFSHSETSFRSCRVPIANRIGDEGQGFAMAQARLGPGRIHHCMRWVGIAERAFELMCDRAVKRLLTPDRALGDEQMVQNWIAESRAELDASRLLVLDAAHKIDREGAGAARIEISIIKFYVAGALQRIIDRAIQVHGALGVTDRTPLSYWYRHERSARIYDGPDEVHKIVVARRILRKFREGR